MGSITVRAPAKLNWTLEVLHRRDDGFHELVSIAQTIGIFDQLSFASYEQITLEVEGNWGDTGNSEENLVVKAARLLQSRARSTRGVHIRLCKTIPASAGLGGGSSDAAVTLRALNAMWGLNFDSERLAEIGSEIGSDVPFFLHGGTARMSGRGTAIAPLPDCAAMPLLVIVPDSRPEQKTALAYTSLKPEHFGDGSCTRALEEALLNGGDFGPNAFCNTFDKVAERLYPEIAPLFAFLRSVDLVPHLAGSGPAVYVALTNSDEGARLAAEVKQRCSMDVIITTTVGRQAATGAG